MPDSEEGVLPTTAEHPWTRIENDSSPIDHPLHTFKQRVCIWQRWIGRVIESRRAHLFILFLLIIDVGCVIADLGYSFLSRQCESEHEPEPEWLHILSHISLGVTSAFLVEIVLALFAFGPQFYNPFGKFPLAVLHLFDAFVIITTFVLEVALKGREQELAALFITLRFWRIVKLVQGVAVGAGELSAEQAEELALTKENLHQTQTQLLTLQGEVQMLRRRLQAAGVSLDDPENTMQERRNSVSSS
ncbi:hypothetical protein P691DRAFT_801570 [Macrolepiota fuliginosa MF-IS2]|uniref:Voltage-gated hydrogen channel 1 n=1 Tax=Macrolepiota fuliginosa MF-IS2 TaxID=1400762 RepID=A0A9P6C9L4_9AGAR|nr:hypothetical protein P691DRAFT_801570 [Macrolepiota fuliginosa MF-IS2]